MRLFVLNGSPRGRSSNTRVILDALIEGYVAVSDHEIVSLDLMLERGMDVLIRSTAASDLIMIGFPLYVDSMPGIVKEYLEHLYEKRDSIKGKRMAFLIHSGFPEAVHSRAVERYCRKFCVRCNCEYVGAIVKGGSEGIRLLSQETRSELLPKLRELGKHLALYGELSGEILEELATPERFEGTALEAVKSYVGDGTKHPYWDRILKNNSAYDERFSRPLTD